MRGTYGDIRSEGDGGPARLARLRAGAGCDVHDWARACLFGYSVLEANKLMSATSGSTAYHPEWGSPTAAETRVTDLRDASLFHLGPSLHPNIWLVLQALHLQVRTDQMCSLYVGACILKRCIRPI